MSQRLKYAIENCTEMDGDFRTAEEVVPGWSNGSGNGATALNTSATSNGSASLNDI